MTIFHHISKDQFLADYWQQQALVFRQCFNDYINLLDGDELAGLACEDEVESRIIKGFEHFDDWCCEAGPFSESDFFSLPEKNWTLLVQGIDQYYEEAQQLLAEFDFLPRWRLEDIMASYAPIGGGVGPHFDYYDVFLIQISGTREWRLGSHCDDATALLSNSSVKLLENFVTESAHELHAGDMLYIPAGQAHWGVASSDDCITFSIGFRAPSEKELMMTVVEMVSEQCAENHRYRDSLPSIDANPAKINPSAQEQLLSLVSSFDINHMRSLFEEAFGRLVTEPRYSGLVDIEMGDKADVIEVIQSIRDGRGCVLLDIPVHTRVAFTKGYLFVNGLSFAVSTELAESICAGMVDHELLTGNAIELLGQLISDGALFFQSDKSL